MARERITITLRPDVLKLVDKMIDGQKIRNRSHAIEVLISQGVIAPNTKVLVLAGGGGVNFRPLTFELPKAMLPVSGKPLLAHTLENFEKQGFDDITISLGHLGEKIKEYFGNGKSFAVNLKYLEQKTFKSGTAQPLAQAEKYFGSEPFILWYGDVLADINLADLIDFHSNQKDAVVTMALTSVDQVGMWGVAKLTGNKIIEFEEKPNQLSTKSHLVNSGIYVVNPEIFSFIKKGAVTLERDVLPVLAKEGKLFGYPFEGSWYDVSTPEVYGEILKSKK